MAVSKNTRRTPADTNDTLLSILRSNRALQGREAPWRAALVHTETGEPPLRFPVYGFLYQINVHSQALIDSLKAVSANFSIDQDLSVYQQALVQYVRSAATRNILSAMADIEHTEAWLFQTQRTQEEKKLADPDDVYFKIREREAERVRQGLPRRIRFLKTPRERR